MLRKTSSYSIEVSGNGRQILLFYMKLSFCHLLPFAKVGQNYLTMYKLEHYFPPIYWWATSQPEGKSFHYNSHTEKENNSIKLIVFLSYKHQWWQKTDNSKSSFESQKGRYKSPFPLSTMFRWEPEGGYRCTKSMALTPFWFSEGHRWRALRPFWFSVDEMHLGKMHKQIEDRRRHRCSTSQRKKGSIKLKQRLQYTVYVIIFANIIITGNFVDFSFLHLFFLPWYKR